MEEKMKNGEELKKIEDPKDIKQTVAKPVKFAKPESAPPAPKPVASSPKKLPPISKMNPEYETALRLIRDEYADNTTLAFRQRRDLIARVLSGGPAILEE